MAHCVVAQQRQSNKKQAAINKQIISKLEQQLQLLRIIVKYAVYVRQEVIAELNYRSTLVAIQISSQQSFKPLY
jgi:hypothetical protein